jgi:Xaa-Pro aminopeptidase
VDPNKEQEAQYAALQEAQAAAVAALVEGAPMSAAYEAVVATLKVSQRSCMFRLRVCGAVMCVVLSMGQAAGAAPRQSFCLG